MWAGHVERLGRLEIRTKFYLESLNGKRPVGRPERRWEVNTVMDPAKWGCEISIGLICVRIGTGGELL
jgi:hypothetical protein